MSTRKTPYKIKVSQGMISSDEIAAVREALEGGYYGHTSKVEDFEESIKDYLDAQHVVATNSGTSALHLVLDALGIGPGDEVIVPSLTYVACFQAVSATGATAIPCDIEQNTLLLDLNDVCRRISPRSKAIIAVDYAGVPCDTGRLKQIGDKYGLHIIEDAAHAFGSTLNGRKVGSEGDIVCFSFDSIKNITCGEGGAIVCRDQQLAGVLRTKRLLGIERSRDAMNDIVSSKEFEVSMQGYRYHMSSINAAIGLAQLSKVSDFISRRRLICKSYNHAFMRYPEIEVLKMNLEEVAPHIYVIRIKGGRRNGLINYLASCGIETAIHYKPNHRHHFFRRADLQLKESDTAYEEIVTLPLHCKLTDNNVDYIINSVISYIES